MGYISAFAVFFILWWLVLFVTLPFNLRTQEEDGEVTLGTVSSAPRASRHMLGAVIRTTLVSGIIFAAFYVAVVHYGWSFDDIPKIGPSPR